MKIVNANLFDRRKKIYITALSIIILLCIYFGSSSKPTVKEPSLNWEAITITEVLSKNASCVINSDGLLRDYVKLTNHGETSVDLEGWGLSDRPYEIRFTFPSVLLAPDESLFLFFSGKDHQDVGNERYANFSLSSAGETLTLFAPTGIASDSVNIPPLNANEVYTLVDGTWRITDTSSYATSVQAPSDSSLYLSEVMTNSLTYAFSDERVVCDYIELFNHSDAPISLADYALSDDVDVPEKVVFPEDAHISPKSTFLLLCTDRPIAGDQMVSTDRLNLNADGETLILFCRSQQKIVDLVHTPALDVDSSYSRCEGGWTFSEAPTPHYENTSYGKSSTDADLRLSNELGIYLSEVLTSNIKTTLPGVHGHYDYIEIYNSNSEPVDLNGFSLSNNAKQPRKWTFENLVIPANGYVLVYCEPDNLSMSTESVVYTNFRLNAGGCHVYLYSPEGTLLDRLHVPSLYSNVSYGRTIGETGLFYYRVPSPGKPNADGFTGYSMQPDVSIPGGLYDRPVSVSLSASNNASIYYTLDGSEPDRSSLLYTEPIEIEKTTTLRACAVSDGLEASHALTQTYFISTYHALPVIALTTDPDNLWNEEDGMHADGPTLNRETQKRPWKEATYWKKSKNAGHIEFYDENGIQQLSQGLIFSCMGQFSLDMPQKSFSLQANSQFGQDTFAFSAFADRPYDSYSALALRNGGQDGLYTRVIDGLQAQLAEQCDTTVITQAWRPVIVYLNGQYWGHYNLRERIGIEMIAQHEGWNIPENIDLLEGNGTGSGDVINGSNAAYRALVNDAKAHDLASEPEALEHVLAQVDIENMIDYFFLEMFYGNTDSGNIRFYRNAIEGDGKWRYVLYDLDWGLFDSSSGGPALVLNPEGMGAGDRFTSNILIVKLLDVPAIRDAFLTRGGKLFQTVLTTENMIAQLDEMVNTIQPEMSMHFGRWAAEMYPQISLDQPKNPEGAYAYWQERVERARNVMRKRPTLFWNMIKEYFNLSEEEMTAYFGACPPMPNNVL